MPVVFIPAQLRPLTGAAQVEVEGATVREVVAALEAKFPGIRDRLCQGDQLAPTLQVSIDSVMTTQGLRAKVSPESEVHFLPAIGGG
ncbi:MAG: MoaD/ThiS family protein [Planctomycetes bacterium]|nr:MoaD/ThiS family protein [Planctomycetota bacterium]